MRPREWTRTRSLKRDPDFTLIVKFGGEVNRNGTNPFQKKFIFTQRFNEVTINTCHDLNIQETLLGKEDDGSINNNNKKRLIPPFVAKETKRALVSAAQESKVDWIRQTLFRRREWLIGSRARGNHRKQGCAGGNGAAAAAAATALTGP